MKKIICKREYDTDTAKIIKRFTSGEFGSSDGYEEILYETPDGKLFLYTNGGEDSPYKKENIKSISAEKAEIWKKEH